METGILFVLHGRRHKMTKANLNSITAIQRELKHPSVIAFLEGEQETLEDGILTLRQQGVRHYLFLPVLLFEATHVRQELPARGAAALTPTESAQYLEPLGTTRGMIQHLTTEMGQAMAQYPYEGVLIAHGTTHYPEPAQLLAGIAAEMTEALGRPVTALNYLGEPNYLEELPQIKAPVIIQRYFLTDGFLANKIKSNIEVQHPYQDIFLLTLEDTSALTQAIKERLVVADVSDFS